jgi:hypothetical protein
MEESRDPESGAILFKRTSEEKQQEELYVKFMEQAPKIDYIYRFLRRYEPVFEDLLNKRD